MCFLIKRLLKDTPIYKKYKKIWKRRTFLQKLHKNTENVNFYSNTHKNTQKYVKHLSNNHKQRKRTIFNWKIHKIYGNEKFSFENYTKTQNNKKLNFFKTNKIFYIRTYFESVWKFYTNFENVHWPMKIVKFYFYFWFWVCLSAQLTNHRVENSLVACKWEIPSTK